MPVSLTASLGGYSVTPGSLPAAPGSDGVVFRDGGRAVWAPVVNDIAQASIRPHRGVNRITAKYTGGFFEVNGAFAGYNGPSPTVTVTILAR
jgi:hypothetical protein